MITVALFGADEDSVLVRLRLREGGLGTVGAYVQELQSGAVDLEEFLERHRPDVVIYDLIQRELHHVVVSWAACILIRPYDADMARLAIREAIDGTLEDEDGEAAA
jgi:hypothetical protein